MPQLVLSAINFLHSLYTGPLPYCMGAMPQEVGYGTRGTKPKIEAWEGEGTFYRSTSQKGESVSSSDELLTPQPPDAGSSAEQTSGSKLPFLESPFKQVTT